MRRFVLVVLMTMALLPLAAQATDVDINVMTTGIAKDYTVVKGDTLRGIADREYGDYRLWPALWYANCYTVPNPDLIEVDQRLDVYKLPFEARPEEEYGWTESTLMSKAYIRAYEAYLNQGDEWTDQRRWVLLEGRAFDPYIFENYERDIDLSDHEWFAAREGTTYVPSNYDEEYGMDAVPSEPETVTLSFVETSDVHGSLFPYNFITAKPASTSLAQVSTLVQEQRAQYGENNVVLLDGGDMLQGQPPVYYYNFIKTEVPHIWAEAANYLGYDAIAVGNHDIEAGHLVYDKLNEEISAQVLCANAIGDDGLPYFTPYTTIERSGLKIAILGMITPKIPDWLPSQFWSGMTFQDMVECAKIWVPRIMENEKPDVLIGLFHAGVDYSYGGTTANTPNNENAAQLVAERVPGFDMIFVGHDHQGWEGLGWDPAKKARALVYDPNGKLVPIFGAVNGAKNAAVVEMTLTRDSPNQAWDKSISGELVPIEGVATDTVFMATFKEGYDEVKSWVDRPIGQISNKITTQDSMFGDSAFVDLIHSIQFELCSDPDMGLEVADISFAAPLAFNATLPSSAEGTVYVRDMFNLYAYENFLYTMELTGKQVKDFLEYSYGLWFETMPNAGNHIINFLKDANGKIVPDARTGAYQTASRYYNYDSAAGIDYTVDVTKPVGERITITGLSSGYVFDPEETYSVAINSYRAQGGGGHLEKGAGLNKDDILNMWYVTSATTKDLRYYLIRWFENQASTVGVEPLGNWKVIPEELAATGALIDKVLLYPPAK